MRSIKIVSDGTPYNTIITTMDGHKIEGVRSLEIKLAADDQIAIATLGFVSPKFEIAADMEFEGDGAKRVKHFLMSEHNRSEMQRIGIGRIH